MIKQRTDIFGESQIDATVDQKVTQILNDKQNLKRSKLQQIIEDFRKNNEQESNKINLNINEKLQKIKLVQEQIDKSEHEYHEMLNCYREMDKYYNQNQNDILKIDKLDSLITYRRNIQKVIEYIKNMMNIQKKLGKLQKMIEQDQLSDYPYINLKIMKLMVIKDNIFKPSIDSTNELKLAISKSISSKQDSFQYSRQFNNNGGLIKNESIKLSRTTSSNNIIEQEFNKLEDTNHMFMVNVKRRFSELLDNNSMKEVLMVFKFIEYSEDQINEYRKNQQEIYNVGCFMNLFKELLKERIEQKFDESFKKKSDLGSVIQKSQFIIQDMVRLAKVINSGFNIKHRIFEYVESIYKEKYTVIIQQALDQQDLEEQYGNLIALLEFIDSYEGLVQKESQRNVDFVELKMVVKYYMPQFLEHIEKLLNKHIIKCIESDKSGQQSLENIKMKIQGNEELISDYGVDIYKFINDQIQLVGNKLDKELFIEFVRIISCSLQMMIEELGYQLKDEFEFYYKQQIEDQIKENNDNSVSPLFKFVLFNNNIYKCIQFNNETKQLCYKFNQELVDRLDNIFIQELNKNYNKLVADSLECIQIDIFIEIEIQIFPQLFTKNWLEQQFIQIAVNTLADYFIDLKNTIISPIYANRVIRNSLGYLVDRYFHILIKQSKKAFGILDDFNDEHKPQNRMKMEIDKSEQDQSVLSVLSNCDKLYQKVKQEQQFIEDKMIQDYDFISAQQRTQILQKMAKFACICIQVPQNC